MDFFSKCDQICRKLRIRSHLLKKFLIENCILYSGIVGDLWTGMRSLIKKKLLDSIIGQAKCHELKFCYVQVELKNLIPRA